MSFMLGKIKALAIYNNSEIKYIKHLINNNATEIFAAKDSTNFKLIGFLGDKLIIGSLDNKQTVILNQSSISNLVIEIKKKK